MPRYEYACRCGLRFEVRAGFDDEEMPCPRCGELARRLGVYHDQFINCETGPKGGRKNEPPRAEKSYRRAFKEYQEAAGEVDYAYSKTPEVKPPNLYKEGVRRAKKRGAKVRA